MKMKMKMKPNEIEIVHIGMISDKGTIIYVDNDFIYTDKGKYTEICPSHNYDLDNEEVQQTLSDYFETLDHKVIKTGSL